MKYTINRFGYDANLKKTTRREIVEDRFKPPSPDDFIDADLKCSSNNLLRPAYRDEYEFLIKTTGEKDAFGIETIESEEFGPWKYVIFDRRRKGGPRWTNGFEDAGDQKCNTTHIQ